MSVDPACPQSLLGPEASSSRESSPMPEESYASLQMSSANTLDTDTGKKILNPWGAKFLQGKRKKKGTEGHLSPSWAHQYKPVSLSVNPLDTSFPTIIWWGRALSLVSQASGPVDRETGEPGGAVQMCTMYLRVYEHRQTRCDTLMCKILASCVAPGNSKCYC